MVKDIYEIPTADFMELECEDVIMTSNPEEDWGEDE